MFDLQGSSHYSQGSVVSVQDYSEAWRVAIPNFSFQNLLAGDVTGDGNIEIVTVQNHVLYVVSSDGTILLNENIAITGQNQRTTVTMLEDVTGDGKLEIGISYQRSTSGPWKARIYSGTGDVLKEFTKNVNQDGRLVPLTFVDGDMLIDHTAAFSRTPRGISRWDYESAEMKWAFNVGPPSYQVSVADATGDGLLEISLGTRTVHNGASANNTNDANTYTIVINENGEQLLIEPYQGTTAERKGWLSDMFVQFASNQPYKMISFKGYNPIHYRGQSRIHIRNMDGTIAFSRNGHNDARWEFGWADMDHNGIKDIVVTNGNNTSNTLMVLDHELAVKHSKDIPVGHTFRFIADLSGDGNKNIVVASENDARVTVYDHRLDEVFSWQDESIGKIKSVIASDLNNDGIVNIVVLSDEYIANITDNNDLAGTETYNISSVADLPYPITRGGITKRAIDGKIYVFGGFLGSEPFSDKVLKFDISKNEWSDLGSILPYGMRRQMESSNVAVFNESTLYLTPTLGPNINNGWGLHRDIMEFSTVNNDIDNKASFPVNSWSIAPITHGEYVYLFGRHTGRDHRNVFRYHPASNNLEDLGELLPNATSDINAIKTPKGIYLIGGRGQHKSLIIFDPETEAVTFDNDNFFPFETYIGGAWLSGSKIFIIEKVSGLIYELNIINNELNVSNFQLFDTERYYNPMVSKDENTGIVYLVGGVEGESLTSTVRKLIPTSKEHDPQRILNIQISEFAFEKLDPVDYAFQRELSQNKLSIALEVSNLTPNTIRNVVIEAELDGQPLIVDHDISYNISSSIYELNGFGKTYVRINSQPFSNYVENAELIINVKEINGKASDISLIEDYSLYFAYSEALDRGFEFGKDNYSFQNPRGLSMIDILSIIKEYINGGLAAILFYSDALRGRCYGMAATSARYFEEPYTKPRPGSTFALSSTDDKVMKEITRFHASQRIISLVESFDQKADNAHAFYKLIHLFKERKNAIMAMYRLNARSGHAVTPTRVQVFENKGIAIIDVYENDVPGQTKPVTFALYYLENETFDYGYMFDQLIIDAVPVSLYSPYSFYSKLGRLNRERERKIFSSASPVYMLIENTKGELVGYQADGSFINQIDGAEIYRIATGDAEGDSLTIAFVPADENYNIKSYGFDEGTMRFEYYIPSEHGGMDMGVATEIPVSTNSVATFNESFSSPSILIDLNGDGSVDEVVMIETTEVETSVLDDGRDELPSTIILEQNYPNPFNPSTQIRFSLPNHSHVNLTVFNLIGQRIATLVNEPRSSGWHDVTFDASGLSSGVYIYRLEADGFVETKSMMFVK